MVEVRNICLMPTLTGSSLIPILSSSGTVSRIMWIIKRAGTHTHPAPLVATPSLTKHIWLYWPNEDLEYVLEYVLRKLRKGFPMALLGSHHKHRSRQHCP